ncbi:MAG: methyltransferase domain-containing protein [Actinomycetota bacterium]
MSVHLDYDEPVLGYHRIVAALAADRAPAGATIADFGCGPGQILGELAARRDDVRLVGIDGDEECLRRAAERCPGAELARADLGSADAIRTGLDQSGLAEGIDVIVSSHALEHLSDPVTAMAHWAELLNPGGCLVIAVPNALQPIMLARALVRREKANDGHYYIWDRATFENFCRLAGFRIMQRAVDYVPLVPVRVRRRIPGLAAFERALLGPFPQFANSHIVVLEPAQGTSAEDLGQEAAGVALGVGGQLLG